MAKKMKVVLGSDHAGFELKEEVRKFLEKKRVLIEDYTPEKIEGDDYPDVAFEVALRVRQERDLKGILVCGTGLGMVIAANKVPGARAVVAYDKYTAVMSREHGDANILALRGRNISPKKISNIVWTWLNTKFSGAERHLRRLKLIQNFEKRQHG